MANVIIFDEQTLRVTQYLKSVNTPDFEQRSDVLVNPSLPTVDMKYMKVNGGQVVEMTEEEKANVDNELAPSYQELRSAAYPELGDQLDMIYHAIAADESLQTSFSEFYTTITNIKNTYPKE